MSGFNRNKMIRELIKSTDQEFSDEELMHLLLDKKISANLNNREADMSFGQKAADAVAKFAGSWGFISCFVGVMVIWVVVNALLATRAFDSYPFILLNLVLSCVAAIQAPVIMMSQNRQEEKDRARAENDYRVNLKSELIVDDLHRKLDRLLENQKKLFELMERSEMAKKDQEQS